MARANDLEGQRDMGGKHGGQKGMPKPELPPAGARIKVLFATSGDRNNPRTKRVPNTSAGKIGAMIRLVIRNSDSPFRRWAIYIGHRPPSAAATEVLHLPAQSPTRPPRLTALN